MNVNVSYIKCENSFSKDQVHYLPSPSLFRDMECLALKPIGLSYHSRGSNTVEEDITVSMVVTD